MEITVSGVDLRNLIRSVTGAEPIESHPMSLPPAGEAFALRPGAQYTEYAFSLTDAQVEVLRAHFEGRYCPRDIARALGVE